MVVGLTRRLQCGHNLIHLFFKTEINPPDARESKTSALNPEPQIYSTINMLLRLDFRSHSRIGRHTLCCALCESPSPSRSLAHALQSGQSFGLWDVK